MPGGDRTGPMGMGPMTGRAAGFCAGYAAPGYTTPAAYGGGGFGRGGGRGRRRMFYATGLTGWQRANPGVPPLAPNPPVETRDQQVAMLKAQAEQLTQALENISAQIDALSQETES